MKILITGAAGWIGRHLTEALGRDHELVLVDRADPGEATVFDPDAPGGRRVEPLTSPWPYHRLDLLDSAELATALEGVDVVVHLAARPTGEWSAAEETLQSNVVGTFTLLRAAVAAGVRRFVNASSINAFGSFFWRVSDHAPVRWHLPLDESTLVLPEDPYSFSKATTELMTQTFARAFGIEVVNLRFAGVWPEQRYDRAMQDGLPETQGWDGALFSWVHVRDVVAGIRLAVAREHVIALPITLGAADTSAPESSLELIRRFRPDLEPLLVEPIGDRAALLSIARARTHLGYVPAHSLAGAVQR